MIDAADRFEILKLLSELEQTWRALSSPDLVSADCRVHLDAEMGGHP